MKSPQKEDLLATFLNLGQNGLKPTPLMTLPTRNPKSKIFHFLMQIRKLSASFEGLNNSLAQPAGGVMELLSGAK